MDILVKNKFAMTIAKSFLKYLVVLLILLFGKQISHAALPDTLNSTSLEYEYAFEEAIKQYNFGNYSQSLFLFRKCLEVNNKSIAANYQMANIYLMAGESQNALGFARAAYKLDNSNRWVSMLLIKCYQLVDKNDSAILVMEGLLKTDNENLDLKYEYGNLLSAVGRFSEAIDCFNSIDARAGINEGTSLARNQIYVQKKDFNNAVKELESLIQAFPDEIRYMGMLAELYSSLNQIDKAKEVYKTIFQLDSTNSLALISITDFYRTIKEYGKASVLLSRVLDNHDVQLDSKMGLIIAYIRSDSDLYSNQNLVRNSIGKLAANYPSEIKIDKLLVDYFIRTNDYDSAIVAIEKFIGNEESQDIWEQYYLLLNSRKKYSSIIHQFNDAKKYAGNIAGIFVITGIANLQLNKYRDAVDALNEGFKVKGLKPDEKAEILEYKAEALFKLRAYRESDSCFEEVLKFEPLNYLVLNNYSYYLGLRDTALRKACTLSRKTVIGNPKNAVYLDTYGYLLMKRQQYNKAYKWLKMAVEYNVNGDPDIYEHMGDILFFKRDLDGAKDFWNKAIEKGSKSLNIADKIKSLKK